MEVFGNLLIELRLIRGRMKDRARHRPHARRDRTMRVWANEIALTTDGAMPWTPQQRPATGPARADYTVHYGQWSAIHAAMTVVVPEPGHDQFVRRIVDHAPP